MSAALKLRTPPAGQEASWCHVLGCARFPQRGFNVYRGGRSCDELHACDLPEHVEFISAEAARRAKRRSPPVEVKAAAESSDLFGGGAS
jgi:hypothetical protein